MTSTYQPGRLVHVRGRDWVVQPSDDDQLLVLKPLTGGDDETTAIYLPLAIAHDQPRDTQFAPPTTTDIGDFLSAKMLYEAARLSFRNGAGPFRSLGKISFRPRSYQMVPLIMALKQMTRSQSTVRLLIADDVGVGKTIEALLIAREMLERRMIERFAVLCPPHLCEQWQDEIKTKFDIDAVIIRSNTAASLDRAIHGDVSVYQHFKYQIISIDYIKSGDRRNIFINESPELIIVDEAHTCTQSAAVSAGQQQRHSLLDKLSQKNNQHMVLLTATPHSGKADEFQSLLKLIKPEFATVDLTTANQRVRADVAQHFIQRKRADVVTWLGDDTPFPKREPSELAIQLAKPYAKLFDDILAFTRGMVQQSNANKRSQRVQYWTALAILRAVISSPPAGVAVLTTRMNSLPTRVDDDDDSLAAIDNPVADNENFTDSDAEPTQLSEQSPWNDSQRRRLRELRTRLEALANPTNDAKLSALADVLNGYIRDGYKPIVFCRYILTAKYVGQHLPALLKDKQCTVEVITSEDHDDVRRQRIKTIGNTTKHVLVATDCLSEGINLQDTFDAVVHYDLPWNPNRIEQREGRVDRYGQSKLVVKTCLMYSTTDIDAVVLDVLIRKIREIRAATGIHIPFPSDTQSIIDTITNSILLSDRRVHIQQNQGRIVFNFDEFAEIKDSQVKITREIEAIAAREQATRSMFNQLAIPAHEIERDLKEVDEALGDPQAVTDFVSQALSRVSVQMHPLINNKLCYTLTGIMPDALRPLLNYTNGLKITFHSPTPKGVTYIGRNHPFVEQLCRLVLANTLERVDSHLTNRTERIEPRAARVAVIRTNAVTQRTIITLLRCRNVIEPTNQKYRIVAEEMLVWGWSGSGATRTWYDHASAKKRLFDTIPTEFLTPQAQAQFLTDALTDIDKSSVDIDQLAEAQAQKLVESHQRFSKLANNHRFQVVHPVLPMDVLGVYVMLPE
jgi:superfamily II DNA or RNA helicase